jgi:hypothetical protein
VEPSNTLRLRRCLLGIPECCQPNMTVMQLSLNPIEVSRREFAKVAFGKTENGCYGIASGFERGTIEAHVAILVLSRVEIQK